MNCPTGAGSPTMQHNELRDFIAFLLSEVCYNVSVASAPLQPLTGETFPCTNIEQDWMLLQMGFGVAVIRGSSSMSKCLILMLPLTRSLVCLHCIADL